MYTRLLLFLQLITFFPAAYNLKLVCLASLLPGGGDDGIGKERKCVTGGRARIGQDEESARHSYAFVST